jgi:hypothetical protein
MKESVKRKVIVVRQCTIWQSNTSFRWFDLHQFLFGDLVAVQQLYRAGSFFAVWANFQNIEIKVQVNDEQIPFVACALATTSSAISIDDLDIFHVPCVHPCAVGSLVISILLWRAGGIFAVYVSLACVNVFLHFSPCICFVQTDSRALSYFYFYIVN